MIGEVRQSPDGLIAVHMELTAGPLTEAGTVWIEIYPNRDHVAVRRLTASDVADWWPMVPDPKHVVSRDTEVGLTQDQADNLVTSDPGEYWGEGTDG